MGFSSTRNIFANLAIISIMTCYLRCLPHIPCTTGNFVVTARLQRHSEQSVATFCSRGEPKKVNVNQQSMRFVCFGFWLTSDAKVQRGMQNPNCHVLLHETSVGQCGARSGENFICFGTSKLSERLLSSQFRHEPQETNQSITGAWR